MEDKTKIMAKILSYLVGKEIARLYKEKEEYPEEIEDIDNEIEELMEYIEILDEIEKE